ncbi:MAG: hypothetical protein N3C12_11305 [Candidatus Binatia bacterium]|nr:hypothetical protein [Candidatus Binatia bacterium]
MSYVLRWSNPCRTSFNDVVLEDSLPEPLQLLRVASDAVITTDGRRVWLHLDRFDKGPAGLATIDVSLPADLGPGQVLLNTARLYNGTQLLAEAIDPLVVSVTTSGRLSCALRAQVYARPGTPIRYAARYKNAGTSNTLTVSLPEIGFSPIAFVPPPDTVAGSVVEYRNLYRTAGMVRIDGSVSSSVADGTVLYSWASIEDPAGNAAVCEHRSVVRSQERLSVFLKGPSKWRMSQSATLLARYNGATANNELVIVLPREITLLSAWPPPSSVEDHVLRFANLPVPSGKVRLKLQVNTTLPLPSALTLGATMTDDSGLVAEASTSVALIPQ